MTNENIFEYLNFNKTLLIQIKIANNIAKKWFYPFVNTNIAYLNICKYFFSFFENLFLLKVFSFPIIIDKSSL